MNVRELAARMNLSAGTISAIENGKTGVSTRRLGNLADALGTTSAALLEPPPETKRRSIPLSESATSPGSADWRAFPALNIDPVLEAAIDAYVEVGYHGTSMRTLSTRSHLSVPGIYHHYRDKQELLVRILNLTMSELHWRVAAARQEAGDPLTEVARIVEALALFHTHHRKLAFIGASEMRSLTAANRRLIAGERTRLQRFLDEAIDRSATNGLISPIDAATAGRAIATMCTSLPQWFNPDGPDTPEHIAHAYVHYALAMLHATVSPTPSQEQLLWQPQA